MPCKAFLWVIPHFVIIVVLQVLVNAGTAVALVVTVVGGAGTSIAALVAHEAEHEQQQNNPSQPPEPALQPALQPVQQPPQQLAQQLAPFSQANNIGIVTLNGDIHDDWIKRAPSVVVEVKFVEKEEENEEKEEEIELALESFWSPVILPPTAVPPCNLRNCRVCASLSTGIALRRMAWLSGLAPLASEQASSWSQDGPRMVLYSHRKSRFSNFLSHTFLSCTNN